MGSVKPLLLVALGVLALGSVLNIVGLATPAWTTGSTAELGPFRYCLTTRYGDNCAETEGGEDSGVDATRAMTIIGMLLSFAAGGAILISIVLGLMGKDPVSLLKVAAVAAAAASFLFILIGVIVWAADFHQKLKDAGVDVDLGYSFALCIVGAILILIGGIVSFVGGRGD